jgi:uncharacterized protein YybS (DUF2232 family)
MPLLNHIIPLNHLIPLIHLIPLKRLPKHTALLNQSLQYLPNTFIIIFTIPMALLQMTILKTILNTTTMQDPVHLQFPLPPSLNLLVLRVCLSMNMDLSLSQINLTKSLEHIGIKQNFVLHSHN